MSRKKTPCRSASKPARPACTARLHFESWEQTSPVFAFLIGGKPRKTARCLVLRQGPRHENDDEGPKKYARYVYVKRVRWLLSSPSSRSPAGECS